MRRAVIACLAAATVLTSSVAVAEADSSRAAATDPWALAKSLLLQRSVLGSGWTGLSIPAAPASQPDPASKFIGPCRGELRGQYAGGHAVMYSSQAFGATIFSWADVYANATAAKRVAERSEAMFRCAVRKAVGTKLSQVANGARQSITYKKIVMPRFPKRAADSITVMDSTLAVEAAAGKYTGYQQWIVMRYGRAILTLLVSTTEYERSFLTGLTGVLDARARQANTD